MTLPEAESIFGTLFLLKHEGLVRIVDWKIREAFANGSFAANLVGNSTSFPGIIRWLKSGKGIRAVQGAGI